MIDAGELRADHGEYQNELRGRKICSSNGNYSVKKSYLNDKIKANLTEKIGAAERAAVRATVAENQTTSRFH